MDENTDMSLNQQVAGLEKIASVMEKVSLWPIRDQAMPQPCSCRCHQETIQMLASLCVNIVEHLGQIIDELHLASNEIDARYDTQGQRDLIGHRSACPKRTGQKERWSGQFVHPEQQDSFATLGPCYGSYSPRVLVDERFDSASRNCYGFHCEST